MVIQHLLVSDHSEKEMRRKNVHQYGLYYRFKQCMHFLFILHKSISTNISSFQVSCLAGVQETRHPTQSPQFNDSLICPHYASFALAQWFPKCGARPPWGGGPRDPQGRRRRCETILFTKNK
jgi:hypothetical protein